VPAALQSYQVRYPKDPEDLVRAVRASLHCLSVAPDRISFPLLAAVYRAPFGRVDFSVFLTGTTGVFKTALAALCQQHFGAGMDAGSLPANFASTENALEGLAFHAKDALLVVDDFAPTGRHGDAELHGVAERLFRATGNQQGRSRLGGNGRLSAPRPPRALVLATGEKVPPVHSIRARLLVVELGPGEVNRATLSECQCAGQQGRLAESMGAFLSWIAGRYEERQQRLRARMLEIRSRGSGRAIHARLPAALAELQSGWELFLEFAVEVGAIGRAEQEELAERSQRAFAKLCALQATYQQAGDPALHFVALFQLRWPADVPMWRTAGVGYQTRRRCGAGSANLLAAGGCRGVPKSVGWPGPTYFWSRRPAIKWPRNWPGLIAWWASRRYATGCASAAFWPALTQAARWYRYVAPWRAARDRCFI